MEGIVPLFQEADLIEVDCPLEVVDREGNFHGKLMPKAGHAWARRALEKLFPLPESHRRYGVDGFLWTILPLLGKVLELGEPLGIYKWHERNWFVLRPLEERVAIGVQESDFYFRELESWGRNLGKPCDVDALRRESWFHLVKKALEEVKDAVPAGAPLILVDEDQLCAGPEWAGRRVLRFLERDGKYFGLPRDEEEAVN